MKSHAGWFLTALAVSAFASPTLSDDLAKVNGQTITKEEYLQALERVPVSVPGASGNRLVPAGALVLDQLITQKVVRAEAQKKGMMPRDAEVQKYIDLQKKLHEQRSPGKSFEEALKAQGTSLKQLREEARYRMAETNLLATSVNLTEDDLRKAYQGFLKSLGGTESAQLRVVAPANEAELAEARKLMAAKTDMAKVARRFNPPSLRMTGGLMPQAIPLAQMPAAWRAKIQKVSAGTIFGPVAWSTTASGKPESQVWIKVEKKLSANSITYDEAKPLLKQHMVEVRLADPKYASVKQDIRTMKGSAKFESRDPKYRAAWDDLKRTLPTQRARSDEKPR